MKTMKKNNRLKKTKYKRQMKNNKFIKTKYRIQTKQIQYGGKKYVDGTIPGYQEIKEVIEINYTNAQDELQKLRAHRFYIQKYENVIPESLPENTLIKLETKFFSFGNKVECDDNTYLKLASLNLEKIIKDVLHWNPFLNFPYNYEEYKPVEVYLHSPKPRVEDQVGIDGKPFYLKDFFDRSWWNSQKWWVDTKDDERIFPQEKARGLKAKEIEHEQRMAARREQAVETIFSPPPPQPELPLPPNKDEIIKQLQEEIRRLNEENQQLQKEITNLTSKMQELQSKQ